MKRCNRSASNNRTVENIMKRLYAIALALGLACTPLLAAAQNTPEQAVAAAMQDMREHGMQAVASHMHPDELARFKDSLLPLLMPEAGEAGSSDMVSQALRSAWFGDVSADALRQMTAERFMREFLVSTEQQLSDKLSVTVQELSLRFGLLIGQEQVLGRVAEGQIMHVLLRSRFDSDELGMQLNSVEVVSLRQDADGVWKMLLNSHFDGITQTLGKVMDDLRTKQPTGKKAR